MDEMNKWLKPLILGLVIVVVVCFGAIYSNQNDKYAEKEKAKVESEDTSNSVESIEVDEDGIPTERGYQQLLEREREEGLDEEEEELLKEAEEAYEEDLAEHPSYEDVDNASGANGRMDL